MCRGDGAIIRSDVTLACPPYDLLVVSGVTPPPPPKTSITNSRVYLALALGISPPWVYWPGRKSRAVSWTHISGAINSGPAPPLVTREVTFVTCLLVPTQPENSALLPGHFANGTSRLATTSPTHASSLSRKIQRRICLSSPSYPWHPEGPIATAKNIVHAVLGFMVESLSYLGPSGFRNILRRSSRMWRL